MYGLYAATIFLGAVLVFSIQPLLGKMLLPVMGGTPAVWNTAMVFFQVTLLAGYLYAHLSMRLLGPRRQWLLHLGMVLAGFAFLPLVIGSPGDSVLAGWPAAWVLVTLVLVAGWPFLIVSSTAPLLQRWLAASEHPAGRDPYHLYAASNCGSVLALLAYPFLLEPWLPLQTQSRAWLGGYVLLALLVTACALWLQYRPARTSAVSARPAAPPAWRMRGCWFLWAFIPSGLLLSVTSLITTDLAPMPLLWVVPLALYLLTHIHAFCRRRLVATSRLARLLPLLLVPAAISLAVGLSQPLAPLLMLHLGTLTLVALVFHGMLADHRPDPRYLTDFFVWLALGGAAGGAFNALLAPLLFDRLLEYPLLLALAALALPTGMLAGRPVRIGLLAGCLISIALALGALLLTDQDPAASALPRIAGMLMLLLVAGMVLGRWIGVSGANRAMLVGAGLALVWFVWQGAPDELIAERSFYGTHRVVTAQGGDYHLLLHGNTSHGVQNRHPRYRNVPLAYYHPSGPLGDIFRAQAGNGMPGDIAAVGLGSGSIASYRQAYQRMVFFEIDPLVVRIAHDPALFTYLSDCGRGCSVRQGDARLQLANETPGRFRMIVLDAYSSAAIPLHLLTLEALETMLAALAEDGLIAIHVSSRYVQLAPVLSRLAEELGLSMRRRLHVSADQAQHRDWIHDSEWVVLARDAQALGPLADHAHWSRVAAAPGRAWSDDHAPLWRAYLGQD